jgi:hypothetical protein
MRAPAAHRFERPIRRDLIGRAAIVVEEILSSIGTICVGDKTDHPAKRSVQ